MVESVDITNKKIVIIEGRGDGYNYGTHVDAYDKNGAIGYNTIRIITDGDHYINIENQSTTYDGITLAAKSRLNYPQIDIEKIVKFSNYSKTVSQNILTNIGDSITYEITIKNNSLSDYSSFDVIENIDFNLLVTDQGKGILNENKLKWTILSLVSGQSIKISYTVKVPDDKSLFRKTASNEFAEIMGDELTVFLTNIVGDNYVILRPSIALVSNDDTGNDEIPDTGTDDVAGSEEITNPDTDVYFKCGMLLLAI